MLVLFVVDTSVGATKYVHLAVCIAVRVGLGPANSSGYEDPMTYMCDVFHVAGEYNTSLDPIQLGEQYIPPNEHLLSHQEKCPQ
jgi:hypothetical protein